MHVADESAPIVALYVPLTHAVHVADEVASGVLLHLPELHGVHAVAPAELQEPGAHMLGGEEILGQLDPAGHCVHVKLDVAPIEVLYLPAVHDKHIVLASAPITLEYLPLGQSVHALAPPP